jgi:hypothetical protein
MSNRNRGVTHAEFATIAQPGHKGAKKSRFQHKSQKKLPHPNYPRFRYVLLWPGWRSPLPFRS